LDYANQQILFNLQFVLQIIKFTTKNSNLSLIKSVYNLFVLCKPANYLQCTICIANHQLHSNSTTQLCKSAITQQINYTVWPLPSKQIHKGRPMNIGGINSRGDPRASSRGGDSGASNRRGDPAIADWMRGRGTPVGGSHD
jgi:hypothetical protein